MLSAVHQQNRWRRSLATVATPSSTSAAAAAVAATAAPATAPAAKPAPAVPAALAGFVREKKPMNWIGTRATFDTEHSVDFRRYKAEMSEVRRRYQKEYKEKKAAFDEKRARDVQEFLVGKADQARDKMNRARLRAIAAEDVAAFRAGMNLITRSIKAQHLGARRRAAENRRLYQLTFLRYERAAGSWITNFDQQCTDNLFESQHRPNGFWPSYDPNSDKPERWENPIEYQRPRAF